MTIHGDLYYEGKEFETRMKDKKPGELSDDLRTALGMPVGPNSQRVPPPWLIAMQRLHDKLDMMILLLYFDILYLICVQQNSVFRYCILSLQIWATTFISPLESCWTECSHSRRL